MGKLPSNRAIDEAARPREHSGWRRGRPVEDPNKTKRWGFVTAKPSEFLVHVRRGQVRERSSGQGATCFKFPWDAVSIVPTSLQRLRFGAQRGWGGALNRGSTSPCPNCGAVDPGRYCPDCGQDQRDPRSSLWVLISEFFEEVFSLDGRLMRSFSRLIRPGALTRDWIEGRRASFVSPLRFYLVCSVGFFLVVNVLGLPGAAGGVLDTDASLRLCLAAEVCPTSFTSR